MASFSDMLTNFISNILDKISTQIPQLPTATGKPKEEYKETLKTITLFKDFIGKNDAFLIGGISAAIQTGHDLYRQNDDLDIMCNEEDLPKLIETLKRSGYDVSDKRGIKTGNRVDLDGKFIPLDHELNADPRRGNLLGIGIFTYREKGDEIITHSYAYNEKEGRFIGTEKIMPRELFDLMYNSTPVDYKDMHLKTQSKEYIYMTKSRGTREKDKLDASIIEPTLDEESLAKIDRIRELESQTRVYRLGYDEKGNVVSTEKLPSIEEKVFTFLDRQFMRDTTKSPEELISTLMQSEEYERAKKDHPSIDSIIEKWQEKSKEYTYMDKVSLLTKDYSRQLKSFSRESIDQALDFLQQRRNNGGKATDADIVLGEEAKQIFTLMEQYGASIKQIFVDNNVDLTHITSVSPTQMEGGKIRRSMDRANNYETERVNAVFASSTPVDGKNPYIARDNNGMIRLDRTTYIYGGNNIETSTDENGTKHASLKNPNYIYHINPEKFTPVCNLTIDPNTHQPVFEFSEEWISGEDVDISDPTQVRGVEEKRDITELLQNFTVLCDVHSQGIGIELRKLGDLESSLSVLSSKIKDGSVRNINQETGINVRDIMEIGR